MSERMTEERSIDLRGYEFCNPMEVEEMITHEAEKLMNDLQEEGAQDLGFKGFRFSVATEQDTSYPVLIISYDRDEEQ